MTDKEKLLSETIKESNMRNSMGCSEDWYNCYYAIQHTFTREEIEKMSDAEIANLVKLAVNLSEAFY